MPESYRSFDKTSWPGPVLVSTDLLAPPWTLWHLPGTPLGPPLDPSGTLWTLWTLWDPSGPPPLDPTSGSLWDLLWTPQISSGTTPGSIRSPVRTRRRRHLRRLPRLRRRLRLRRHPSLSSWSSVVIVVVGPRASFLGAVGASAGHRTVLGRRARCCVSGWCTPGGVHGGYAHPRVHRPVYITPPGHHHLLHASPAGCGEPTLTRGKPQPAIS